MKNYFIAPSWQMGTLLLCAALSAPSLAQAGNLRNPILYVTQVPPTEKHGTVVSIGGSHMASVKAAPRGGDLMIHYPSGTTKNLTRSAGYGEPDRVQARRSIAVRNPHVHWTGSRALFSMVVGAPVDANDRSQFYWQIYEISGLGENDTPVIERVAGQPENFNNIQPAYSSDDRIIFVSDRTRTGDRTLYPAIDEQGKSEAVTGLWSLDRTSRKVTLLEHSPSGSFEPFVDSFGRVVFSRWDHLQRDELAADTNDAYDYVSEAPDSSRKDWTDIFPEPLRDSWNTMGHTFDLFLPWTINQDGTGLLTMNHLGRHELGTSFTRARKDSNLVDFKIQRSTPELELPNLFMFAIDRDIVASSLDVGRDDVELRILLDSVGKTRAGSFLQITEHPNLQGKFIATDAVAVGLSAGRLVSFDSPPSANADKITVSVVNDVGMARDPSYLEDGTLMASFTSGPPILGSYGGDSTNAPNAPDRFRVSHGEIDVEGLSDLTHFMPERDLPFQIQIVDGPSGLQNGTAAVPRNLSDVTNFFDGRANSFNGPLWQLQPVEVRARSAPRRTTQENSQALESPERQMFNEAGVSIAAVKAWLKQNDLALLVSRNVTSRDQNDKQQPYNLVVPGGVASVADNGPAYEVTNLQFFQGDYVRGYNNRNGRRIAARVLHQDNGENLPTDIAGSAQVAPDGSMAMIVPAARALTWHLTDAQGTPVVRERYWLSFQAGEIRSCNNCHGQNSADQLGRPDPSNPPRALRTLLADWSARHPEANAKVFPFESWAEQTIAPGASPHGDADSDGLTNFEEFAFGTDPLAPTQAGSRAYALRSEPRESGEVHLTFTRNVNAAHLRYAVETSEDLSSWDEAGVIEGTSISTDGSIAVAMNSEPGQSALGVQQFSVTSAPANSSRYFRLRIREQ